MALKIDRISDFNVNLNKRIARGISKTLIRYSDWVMQDHIYSKVRQLTKPLHWSWINAWLDSIKASYNNDPFKEQGVYIVTGEPGSGKSSLAFEIMHRVYQKTGKGSYINTAIEVPRVDENTFQKYVINPRYQLTDFFNNGDIIMWPNEWAFGGFHIDEAHQVLQYRENQTTEYMKIFKGLIKYGVGIRHYIGHMFVYTQMDKVDTQLMALAQDGKILEVKVKKGFDYNYWMETGKFQITILGWDLTFYKAKLQNGSWIKTPIFTTFYERTFDLKYFDTYNLKGARKDALFDNRYKVKEVRV